MSEEGKRDIQEETQEKQEKAQGKKVTETLQENQVEEKSVEEFSFVRERFKDELPSGKRLFHKSLKLAGCGIIFGVAAGLVFYALQPFLEKRFGEPTTEISIPKDEEMEDNEEAQVKEEQAQIPATLTIDNYKELNQMLLPIANETGKSIVEVRGVFEDELWSTMNYDENNSVAGVYLADNGQEALILTYSSVLWEAAELQVTFVDNQVYVATPKIQDGNTGLAVIAITKSSIKESTWNQIEPATLGNSNVVSRGDAIIALGKPHGFAGGIGYGIISASKNHVEKVDGIYGILNTDMAASSTGTGVLINLKGEIVGLIDQSIAVGDSAGLVTAYAVSDMKTQIGNLLNGKGVPYTGILGVDITDIIAESEGLPDGVYVREVIPDSPAMIAGVKTGDIIIGIGNVDVSTIVSYQRQLMELQVGDTMKMLGKRLGNEGYVDIQFDITVGSIE